MVAPTFTCYLLEYSLVEYLIWGVLLLFAVKGCLKGLVREVCSLSGLAVGGWAAFRFSSSLAVMIKPLLPLPHSISVAVAFLLTIFASGLLFWAVGHVLTVIFKLVLMGGINRVGGTVFGLLEGSLLLSILLPFAMGPSAPSAVKHKIEASSTARPFIACGRELQAGWRHVRNDPGKGAAGAAAP